MIDRFLAQLREPRLGLVFLTAVVSLLMSTHWKPMTVVSLAAIALCVVKPTMAMHAFVWWLMAVLWFAALVTQQERMEDHVYLFSCWLVALAISLSASGDAFLDRVSWHARTLIGVTFSVAVLWKLWFNQFVTGMALWGFMVVDRRFAPLAAWLGISDSTLEQGRAALERVVVGTTESYAPPSRVLWRIAIVAVVTLVVEVAVAVSHLAPDTSVLASVRLPALVLFGLMTYSVVPVLPFAGLLALLAMVVARWETRVMWVFPGLLLPTLARMIVLQN